MTKNILLNFQLNKPQFCFNLEYSSFKDLKYSILLHTFKILKNWLKLQYLGLKFEDWVFRQKIAKNDLSAACFKLKAGPNPAHFSSSTKFSPLRRRHAEFGQREFADAHKNKHRSYTWKRIVFSAQICRSQLVKHPFMTLQIFSTLFQFPIIFLKWTIVLC